MLLLRIGFGDVNRDLVVKQSTVCTCYACACDINQEVKLSALCCFVKDVFRWSDHLTWAPRCSPPPPPQRSHCCPPEHCHHNQHHHLERHYNRKKKRNLIIVERYEPDQTQSVSEPHVRAMATSSHLRPEDFLF